MSRWRRFLILLHRYVGIPMSVVFIVWFVSGIVMIYAGGMPTVTQDERLRRLPSLDLDAIRVPPAAAVAAVGMDGYSVDLRVQMLLGRPVYRFSGFTVFADTGAVFEGTTVSTARQAAASFVGQPEERLTFAGTVAEPDQWTLTQQRNLPLDRFTVDDGADTWVYVSQLSGEVTLATDRNTRLWAWLGTIPHWFYFAPLRVNQPLWYQIVVGVSALGCLLALLGLILAITQFKRSRPFSLAKSIRYRGWMRWHYITGALFGVFALTWVFSGLLSMEPFAWTRATGLRLSNEVFAGEPIGLDSYPALNTETWSALAGGAALKEIEYVQIRGEPYFVAHATIPSEQSARERLHEPYTVYANTAGSRGYELVSARTLKTLREPFAPEPLLDDLRAAVPDVAIAGYDVLDDYDAYYYSQAGQAPLPVLRVKLDDPERTWYYIDLRRGRIVAQTHRFSRLERWLFNGLHSLDFRFWYTRRPLWDVGMIVLSLGALATSTIGMFLGMRRLWPKRKLQPSSD